MIEKLPNWPDGPVSHESRNEKMLWQKLNEVIEAVNQLTAPESPEAKFVRKTQELTARLERSIHR